MKNNKKGFTLIELLVVISIIGLLSTLAVVSLSAARTRGRDAKRMADARNIQGALELYASDFGTYPPAAAAAILLNTPATGNCIDRKDGVEATDATCTEPVFMKIPKAQTTQTPQKDQYKYMTEDGGTKYALWYWVEASNDYVCATPTEVKTGVTAEPTSPSC